MTLPDGLTVAARAGSVPFVVLLYAWDFGRHAYWATALFCVAMASNWFDGRIARSRSRKSPLGSLLDPAAGAWRAGTAWWALLVAVVLTWVSGLDYARAAPRLWRRSAVA
ncbi:MAG: CDP-alcohol phosphatidyltransferase family protein [Thermoleophilia bacterium]